MQILKSFHISEVLFALAGVFILGSVFLLYQTHDFTLWTAAKVFYGLALILFIKYT
ncbi:MAG: hypothetical protein Q8P39_02860 [Candidatus Yanofskybacteria bacterium]|nr:hypothetical protein [Candidatus Yanofskybacteria bacterium]